MNSMMIILKRNDYKSSLLFTDNNNLMHEIETKNVYDDFSKNKEIFYLVIIVLNQNIAMIQRH